MPRTAAGITREHIEAFITDLLERWTPATAHNRYRALRSFFGWLVDEGEITSSPMARMNPARPREESRGGSVCEPLARTQGSAARVGLAELVRDRGRAAGISSMTAMVARMRLERPKVPA
jgi:plasmid stabilization system protein ParE